jgi:hypothetical protein
MPIAVDRLLEVAAIFVLFNRLSEFPLQSPRDTTTPRHHDTTTPRHHDTTTPRHHDTTTQRHKETKKY